MSFRMVNTFNIQMQSLINFMDALGYRFDGKRFVTDLPILKRIDKLRVDTAIRLHNLDVSEWVCDDTGTYFAPLGYEHLFVLNLYQLQQLLARKIVTRVKFQYDRAYTGNIRPQGNMVEFVYAEYAKIFGVE